MQVPTGHTATLIVEEDGRRFRHVDPTATAREYVQSYLSQDLKPAAVRTVTVREDGTVIRAEWRKGVWVTF